MVSTGLKGLDGIINQLKLGDNVVWQIDEILEYRDFVIPFVNQALAEEKKVIYFRFAAHDSLLEGVKKINTYHLDAKEGFEAFSTQVNNIITKEGIGAYYVFDCLSDLQPAWATDLMIGNFFMVTCPYLYELDTIAYFSIMRNKHSFKTIARIRETTQLLLDVYKCKKEYYVHPLKVWNRYSPTMFLPHLKKGEEFEPVTDSIHATEVLSYIKKKGAKNVKRNLDYWDRLFLVAEEVNRKTLKPGEKEEMVRGLCRIMIGRDEKILNLAANNFSLSELIEIKSRLIGTGYIGGKATGMLLSRKILLDDNSFDCSGVLEPHDSFFIGSDVFYSFIVQNGWWKLRMEQKTSEGYFDAANILKEKMLKGKFPEEVMEQFQLIMEYFGTSPIIVRSSSLLEDGFGNAFAGKYESVFCPNQGSPEKRYIQFVEAIRTVYSSTMSEDALTYRKQRGLDMMDEQMALLVQRVSGCHHKKYFFPDIGGVGISYNTYVWNDKMKPEAGMLRLVLGMGTRAVNRVEGDYPRVVALDQPLLKPYAEMADVKRFSQHKVDVININKNCFETISFDDLLSEDIAVNLGNVAIKDEAAIRWMKEKGMKEKDSWIITFDNLFSDGHFLATIKKVLSSLERRYRYPVEIEFTVNFIEDKSFRINLLQCRPVQAKNITETIESPAGIKEENILIKSEGYFLGGNILQDISWVIYVDPQKYIDLTISDKYHIARIMGKLNKEIGRQVNIPVLLLGPGRWGTSTPSLGVPVRFAEINNITVMGEMAFPKGNLMPDLSFGTHFFQDLVETRIFYFALFPDKENVIFNKEWLFSQENLFEELVPQASKYKDVVYVYDVSNANLKINSDIVSQKLILFSS